MVKKANPPPNLMISASRENNAESPSTERAKAFRSRLSSLSLSRMEVYVTENTKDDGFIISPNPATTQFTINFLEEQQNTIINIIDITGRIVNNKLLLANGKTATVDMIDYAKGVYFVQITDANKNVVNRKVVVE